MDFELYQQSKSELFLKILKDLEYEKANTLDAKNFEYLFGIPDTKPFFDWFLINVNKNCLLKKDEIDKFKEKCSKGMVIWDLDKLEKMHNLFHSGKTLKKIYQKA